MIKRNETAKNDRKKTARKSGAASYLLILVCGAALLSGFFFAARQHFSSVDYGMKNSKLRRQIDQLQAEKQRLIHAREVSLSPTEIKRSAKRAGLLDPPSSTANVLTSADPIEMKAASSRNATSREPLVQKISVVEPAKQAPPAGKKPETQSKKLVAAR